MRIGILEAGRPPGDLAEQYGDYPAMLERLLGGAHDYRTYDVAAGTLPRSPSECAAWLITGSPAGVYDDLAWIAPLTGFLRETKGKARLVGICFGHQIMAEAFGGRVEKSAKGWGIGLHRYDVVERMPWMDDAESFAAAASHQDQIVAQPPRSRIVARSDFTPFAALSYEDQPAISFQCHPEFETAFARALLGSRRERLPDADAALASLDGPNDGLRVGGWIRRFLDG